MLLSVNWLKDYLQKQDVKIVPQDLADRLTMRGLAVAGVSRPARGLEKVVVGKIEKIEPHPNADRLQLTRVTTSKDHQAPRLQIVCGATNISEGDMVPVALPGTVLPGDFEIKISKIRGVQSEGMICSGKELELSDDAEGILQLPKHSTVGQSLSQLLGSNDSVLEFELTPNRGDCLSIMGLSREIAPILKTKLREPKPPRFRVSSHRTSSILKVEVDDPISCPRYVARIIDNLQVTESPQWIQQRLQSVGIRPINNIVDITNFVMLEYGQPLHAFDLRRVESGTVRVANCKGQSEFPLLSGEVVTLEEGDLLIQDGDRPIAIAGVMGGANTQIEDDTTSILLESACFAPGQIRRTAKRLGLHTESSKRFEKGVDFAAVAKASERAAALLRDSFEANVYHPPIDTNTETPKNRAIAVDMREVRKITGLTSLSAEKAADLLESIGISSHKRSANVLTVKPPTFRPDIDQSIDIIEEVARLIGYETIPEKHPVSMANFEKFSDNDYEFEMKARKLLVALGLRETVHYSFTSDKNLQRFGVHSPELVSLQNPISEEMKVMRPSLLPSLLQTYLYNRNRKTSGQRLFEIAKVYAADSREETTVKETYHVSGLLSGPTAPVGWKNNPEKVDFFFAKGLIEILVRQLTTVFLAYENERDHKLLHPNRSSILKLGLATVGYIGEIHPYVREQVLEADEPIVVFELSLDALRRYQRTTIHFKSPSKFPAIALDIAILVDKSIRAHALVETIKRAGGPLLQNTEVFDVYEGEKIPMGKKSIAFRLSFLSRERTLNENEANEIHDKIVKGLETTHNAQLRT